MTEKSNGNGSTRVNGNGTETAISVSEVMTYLQQQGDTVVRLDGKFLVNDHVILSIAELVERANRMRAEQCMPIFEMFSHTHNGHTPSAQVVPMSK